MDTTTTVGGWAAKLADADRLISHVAQTSSDGDPTHLIWTVRHLATVVHAVRILTVGAGPAATIVAADLREATTRIAGLAIEARALLAAQDSLGAENDHSLKDFADDTRLAAAADSLEAAIAAGPSDPHELLPSVLELTGAVLALVSGGYDDPHEVATFVISASQILATRAFPIAHPKQPRATPATDSTAPPAKRAPRIRNPSAAAVLRFGDIPPGCRGDDDTCTAPVTQTVLLRGYIESETRMCDKHGTEALEDPDIIPVIRDH